MNGSFVVWINETAFVQSTTTTTTSSPSRLFVGSDVHTPGDNVTTYTSETGAAAEAVRESDEEDVLLFEFIIHGIVGMFITCVGLIGNLISIYILSRRSMKSSANLVLCIMSLMDTGVIISSMFMFSIPSLCRFSPETSISWTYINIVFPHVLSAVYPLAMIFQTGAVYLTVLVTIERYIVVCWPLRASGIISYGRIKMCVAFIVIFSVMYNIPRFLELSYEQVKICKNDTPIESSMISELCTNNDDDDIVVERLIEKNSNTTHQDGLWSDASVSTQSNMSNLLLVAQNGRTSPLDGEGQGMSSLDDDHHRSTNVSTKMNGFTSEGSGTERPFHVIVIPTQLRKSTMYISIYITWMYFVFMYAFPFGTLLVLNLLIFLDVRRSNQRRRRSVTDKVASLHRESELRLATMLMIVVFIFLLCNILPFIVSLLELFSINILIYLTDISNLLVTINSSINIFIYTIFGESFKRQFFDEARTLRSKIVRCLSIIRSKADSGNDVVTISNEQEMINATRRRKVTKGDLCVVENNGSIANHKMSFL